VDAAVVQAAKEIVIMDMAVMPIHRATVVDVVLAILDTEVITEVLALVSAFMQIADIPAVLHAHTQI
jgi:hypothetical protein